MDIDMGRVLIAFGLTLIAGLSTGIGSIIAFLQRELILVFYQYH